MLSLVSFLLRRGRRPRLPDKPTKRADRRGRRSLQGFSNTPPVCFLLVLFFSRRGRRPRRPAGDPTKRREQSWGFFLPIFVFFLPTFSFLKEKVRFFFKEKARRAFSMIRFAPIFTALDPRRRRSDRKWGNNNRGNVGQSA